MLACSQDLQRSRSWGMPVVHGSSLEVLKAQEAVLSHECLTALAQHEIHEGLDLALRLSGREQEQRAAHRVGMGGNMLRRRLHHPAVAVPDAERKHALAIGPGGRELRERTTGGSDLGARLFIAAHLREAHLRRLLRVTIEPVREHLPGATPWLFVEKYDAPLRSAH